MTLMKSSKNDLEKHSLLVDNSWVVVSGGVVVIPGVVVDTGRGRHVGQQVPGTFTGPTSSCSTKKPIITKQLKISMHMT